MQARAMLVPISLVSNPMTRSDESLALQREFAGIQFFDTTLNSSRAATDGTSEQTVGRVMLFVATEANAHGCDAGRFGHPIHLRDLPVAHLAFHSGVEVFAMRPGHAREDFVDAYPRNGLAAILKTRRASESPAYSVAMEMWHDMHVLVAGNVIIFPGAGFVWQVAHGKPSARWVLWL